MRTNVGLIKGSSEGHVVRTGYMGLNLMDTVKA